MHKQAFDHEVARIRSNPKLAGDNGTLQEYLRDVRSSLTYQSPLEDGRIVAIESKHREMKIELTIIIPKPGFYPPPEGRKYNDDELDKITFQLPDDLQDLIMGDIRVRVQGDEGYWLPVHRWDDKRKPQFPGTCAWREHLIIYETYAKKYGRNQSAFRLSQRGGFSYYEAIGLGHEWTTWRPSDQFKERFEKEKVNNQ